MVVVVVVHAKGRGIQRFLLSFFYDSSKREKQQSARFYDSLVALEVTFRNKKLDRCANASSLWCVFFTSHVFMIFRKREIPQLGETGLYFLSLFSSFLPPFSPSAPPPNPTSHLLCFVLLFSELPHSQLQMQIGPCSRSRSFGSRYQSSETGLEI